MEHGPMTLVSDAPLDEHTAALLQALAPAQVAVADADDPGATLRSWAQAARGAQDRLVLVDSSLRAEANALANLLDDPRVRTAVLLAHNAIDGVNSEVHVDDRGYLNNRGETAATAGIMVVDRADCPAFAASLDAAAASARTASASAHPWDLALVALTDVCRVAAVSADPFCASREGMELPARSEHDRRLRASVSDSDDAFARVLVRPGSRPLTAWAVTRGVPARTLTWTGFGAGTLATLVIAVAAVLGLTGIAATVTAVVGGVLMLASGLFFLAGGEAVRYLRRPELRGRRLYALTRRVVDVGLLVALGASAITLAGGNAVVAAGALGIVGVGVALSSAATAVTPAGVREHWPVRWLVTAVALIVAGPAWALTAAAAAAALGIVTTVVTATAHRSDTVYPVTTAQRFLTTPGVLIDAGVPVRFLSALQLPGPQLSPRLLVPAAVAVVTIGAAGSWGGTTWVLTLGAIVGVIAMAMALRAPLQGAWAWTVPAAARVVEYTVIVAAAHHFVGNLAPVLVVAAAVLLTADVADRWRLRRRPPAAWVPVAGLGFDGRMLAVAIAVLIPAGGTVVAFVAALVASVWLVAALRFWQPADGR